MSALAALDAERRAVAAAAGNLRAQKRRLEQQSRRAAKRQAAPKHNTVARLLADMAEPAERPDVLRDFWARAPARAQEAVAADPVPSAAAAPLPDSAPVP